MTGIGDLISADWYKSSFSSGDRDCVEVAVAGRVAGVRDSKVEHGPVLAVTADAFAVFLGGVKGEGLGRSV